MKTIKIIFASIVVVLSMNHAKAQLSPYKFNHLYDQAFQQGRIHNFTGAIPALNTLNKADAQHAQIQLLLAMCSIKKGKVTERELQLLENAVKRFDQYHQNGRVEACTAPAKAWFYLAELRAQLKQHDKAVNAYRNYMSCIPMASIHHKKMVIDRIAENKAAARTLLAQGQSSPLANKKP